MEVEPLPSDPPSNTSPDFKSAYRLVYAAQERNKDPLSLMDLRVLGYLLKDLSDCERMLGSSAVSFVVSEVKAAKDDAVLIELGKRYQEKLIRAFRRTRGPIPLPSNHPSRRSFDTIQDMINDQLVKSPKKHSTAKKWALVRDSHRCLVTGAYDLASTMANRDLKERAAKEEGRPGIGNPGVGKTQCCHILGEATAQDLENPGDPGSHKRRQQCAAVLAILKMFGLGNLADIFANSQVHHLSNILTMITGAHEFFDELNLWFECTSVANQYKVVCYDNSAYQFLHIDDKTVVTFQVSDDYKGTQQLALPDPRLLTIHAICCRVAHMSGAAEYFEQCDRDQEEIPVLAENGSTAHVLFNALHQVSPLFRSQA